MQMKSNFRGWSVLSAALLLLALMVSPAAAVELRSGDMVNVSSGYIKGPLFVSGNNITVDADVDGDVFAAGQSVTINGRVNGDVLAAANSVRIGGSVLGDVRAAANTIDFNSPIEGSITAAGNSIGISTAATVKRDVLLMGNTIYVAGPIGGQVLGNGNQIQLNSAINGDVRLWDVQTLTVGPAAVIGGVVTYGSDNQAQIAPEAKIGAISRVNPTVQPRTVPTGPAIPARGISWGAVIWSWAAGLLLWAMAQLLVPRLLPRLSNTAQKAPLPTLGWGILALLLFPMAVLLLMITVIGIPLAFVMIFAYIIIFIAAKVMVGDFLARAMLGSFKWAGRVSQFIAFAVVLLVLVVLSKISMAGFFVSLLIICFALGMVVLTIYRLRPGKSIATPVEPIAPIAPVVAVTPPPPAAPAE